MWNSAVWSDRLLIETRLSPRDIAFIRHPGQRALVKITAYDYAIYGGLDGVVEGPFHGATIQDKVKPEIFCTIACLSAPTGTIYKINQDAVFRLFRA